MVVYVFTRKIVGNNRNDGRKSYNSRQYRGCNVLRLAAPNCTLKCVKHCVISRVNFIDARVLEKVVLGKSGSGANSDDRNFNTIVFQPLFETIFQS